MAGINTNEFTNDNITQNKENNKEPVSIYTELFQQNSDINFTGNSQILTLTDYTANTNNKSSELREILNLVRKIDQNVTILNTKTDRLTNELISIRSEISSIKTKVYGEVACIEHIVPIQPFVLMEQYNNFESSLEDEETFKQFVKELSMTKEKSYEKFIRNLWKRIFSDVLAEQFSWRGTNSKKCIRGSRLTSAIRHSFKNKFSLEDDDFDKITQKFFQYAHDRLNKSAKYQEKKKGN